MLDAMVAVAGAPPPELLALTLPQLEAVRELAWSYREGCWTYRATAAQVTHELDLDPPLRAGAIEWLCKATQPAVQERFLNDAQRMRIEQALQLENLAMRAVQEFERSCQPAVVETVVTGRSQLDREGELVPLPDLETRQVRHQAGSPALLMAALTALGDLRRLFGLDSPQRMVVEHDQQAVMNRIRQRVEGLAQGLGFRALAEVPDYDGSGEAVEAGP